MKKEDIVKLTEKLNKLNNENNKYKTFDSLYKDAIRFGAIVPTGDEHENELQKLKHEAMFKVFLIIKFGNQSIEFFNDLLSKDLFLQYLSYDKKRIDEIKKTWKIQSIEPPTTEPTFKDLLISDDERKQQIIDKIRSLPMSKPKDVFCILAALIDNNIILETEKSKIYTAFSIEFNYMKSKKSLESSCNNLFKNRNAGENYYNTQIKNIEDHLFD